MAVLHTLPVRRLSGGGSLQSMAAAGQTLQSDDEDESQPLTLHVEPAADMPMARRSKAAQDADASAPRPVPAACMTLIYAVAIVMLLWAAYSASGVREWRRAQQAASGVSVQLPTSPPSPPTACPLPYERMSFEAVAAGARPYLFGTQPANCSACRRGYNETSLLWSDHEYCEFWSQNWAPEPWGGSVCPTWLQHKLLGDWIARKWAAPLTLTPCDLWRFLAPVGLHPGRTLWLIGDSQTASHYEAIKCFLHGFLAVAGVHPDSAETAPFNLSELDNPTRLLANQTDIACKSLGATSGGDASGRVCYLRGDVWRGQIRDRVLPLLTAFGGNRRDIMVVNTGLHFSPTYKKDMQELAAWYKKYTAVAPFLVWKDTPTQHFDQTHGEWPSGQKPPFSCKPIAGGHINVTAQHTLVSAYGGNKTMWLDAIRDVSAGGWRNVAATRVMKRAGVPVSATWNETLPLWLYHRDNGAGYECTHYCAPSAPQVWLTGLVQTLRAHVRELNQHFGAEELTGIPAADWPG